MLYFLSVSDTEIYIEVKDADKAKLRENCIFRVQFYFLLRKGKDFIMRTRIAVISIIVENPTSIEVLNRLLSDERDYIIGRMGIPYKQKGVSLISIAMDAPENVINTLAGRIGKLDGVSAKTNYSNIITED